MRTAFTAPPWVTLPVPTGSASDCVTEATAARWHTAAQPSTASRILNSLRTSPAMSWKWPPCAAASASAPRRFSCLPVLKSSRTRTSCPAVSRASTRCEPMNPAPPVTRIRPSMRPSYCAKPAGPSPPLPAEQPLHVVEREEDEQHHEQHGAESDHALQRLGVDAPAAQALDDVEGDVPPVERQDRQQVDEPQVEAQERQPVSYTHLTLPTIYSV